LIIITLTKNNRGIPGIRRQNMNTDFMHVNKLDNDSNYDYEVLIPIVTKYAIEKRYLKEHVQRVFSTGLLVNTFGFNSVNYKVIHTDAHMLGQVSTSARSFMANLLNFLVAQEIKERNEYLSAILAALSGAEYAELSNFIFRTGRKQTLTRIKEMDQSIYNPVYKMLPMYKSDVPTVSLFVNKFSMQLLRPMNYNVRSDVEIWQAIIHTLRCGLYLVRIMHNVRNQMTRSTLEHIVLAILHISQQNLCLIGK